MLLSIIQPTIFEWESGFGLKSLRIEGTLSFCGASFIFPHNGVLHSFVDLSKVIGVIYQVILDMFVGLSGEYRPSDIVTLKALRFFVVMTDSFNFPHFLT
jgi:hypothetical protein